MSAFTLFAIFCFFIAGGDTLFLWSSDVNHDLALVLLILSLVAGTCAAKET